MTKNLLLLALTGWAFFGVLTAGFSQSSDVISPSPAQWARWRATTPAGMVRCSSAEAHFYRQQRQDATDLERMEDWLQPVIEKYKKEELPGMTKGEVLMITIPVVVHVVHDGIDNTLTGSTLREDNIPDAQVLSQIEVLNEDFRRILGTPGHNTDPDGADIQIEFCLAQTDPDGNSTDGINRINGPANGFPPTWALSEIDVLLKPNTIWNPDLYLNFWSVRFTAALLGYAQFPDEAGLMGMGENCSDDTKANDGRDTDGVVVNCNAFGSIDDDDGSFAMMGTYDRGRTATHEIGHWLGLRHIWGDGDCDADDFCEDTPRAGGDNGGCAVNANSCNDMLYGRADDPNDMVQNYMDYSADTCMNIFTEDQKLRMRSVMAFAIRHKSLINSPVCSPPGAYASFATNYTAASEGKSNGNDYRDFPIEINVSQAPATAGTVTLVQSGGTAVAGTDYQLIGNPVSFPAGSTDAQTVTLRIMNDVLQQGKLDIMFNLSAAGGVSLAPTGGDGAHQAEIFDDETDAFDPAPQTVTLLNENFDAENFPLPLGWNRTQLPCSQGWMFGNNVVLSSGGFALPAANTTSFWASNDDDCGCEMAEDRMIMPALDFDKILNGTVSLTFDYFLPNATSTGSVEVSTDNGATWTEITTVAADASAWVTETTDLSTYTGQTNVLVAFRHNDTGTGRGFAIDNVSASMAVAGALAIEGVNFNARAAAEAVMLDWRVLRENNIVNYRVQHSVNGYEFETIGEMSAVGTANGPAYYDFADEKPQDGINYYRVQQVSETGEIEETDIRIVQFTKPRFVSGIYPNPATDNLTVVFAKETLNARVTLTNTLGQIVKTKVENATEQTSLDVSNLTTGVYFVTAEAGGTTEVYKVFIKR